MGSRKRQDLLSKLGTQRLWERVEGERREVGKREKMYSSIKINKKELRASSTIGTGITEYQHVKEWN